MTDLGAKVQQAEGDIALARLEAKASQLIVDPNLSALVYGAKGCGKTCSNCY